MSIHGTVKATIKEHKSKIEYIQQAVISSIASIVYSDYISRIRQKDAPMGRITKVPAIQTVKHYLDPDGMLMDKLSEYLISAIAHNDIFAIYSDAPEFVLFKDEHIEILKTIFDLYMIPNIARVIPEVIARKFNLLGPGRAQFREDPQVPVMDGMSGDSVLAYIRDETVLNLIVNAPIGTTRTVEVPDGNLNMHMTETEILSINSDQAICPIYFNKAVFDNKEAMELLKFVTSTKITDIDHSAGAVPCKGESHEWVSWIITTSPFNQVKILKVGLNPMAYSKNDVEESIKRTNLTEAPAVNAAE